MGPHAGSFPLDTLFSTIITFEGNSIRSAEPRVLLPPHVRISPLVDSRSHYALDPDGQRFLLRQADGVPGPPVKMILNWPALLRTQ
jgi:hypothetical protein